MMQRHEIFMCVISTLIWSPGLSLACSNVTQCVSVCVCLCVCVCECVCVSVFECIYSLDHFHVCFIRFIERDVSRASPSEVLVLKLCVCMCICSLTVSARY